MKLPLSVGSLRITQWMDRYLLEFWYAIRARAYFSEIDKDAELKMTIVTRYDVVTKSTVVLLKYRSFNDLPTVLKRDLI
jgi:hypothetical protein